MTKEDLVALLPEWQKRLRLQDWDIRLLFKKHTDGYLGRCRLNKYKAAEIELQDSEFIDPDCLGNLDAEVSLVHELLHVQGGALTQHLATAGNERWADEMERVVELTAIALVELRRRTYGDEPEPESGSLTDWCQCGHMEGAHAGIRSGFCKAEGCHCPQFSHHHHLTEFKRGLRIERALANQGLAALIEFHRYLSSVPLP